MKRCGGLTTVKMQWVNEELCDWGGGRKSTDRLRAEYRLDGLLGLTKLKKITFLGPGVGIGGHQALQGLKKWLEDEYAERGQTTTVVLT